MPDEPKKLFDLMDTETEPTDEQLEQLMGFVAESVAAQRRDEKRPLTPEEISVLADQLVERLRKSEG